MKILDRHAGKKGYTTFKKCSISSDGGDITFTFINGESYNVPISYFKKWHYEPHYILHNGKWIEWNSDKHIKKTNEKVLFVRYRRISSGIAVKVYLSNGTAFIIPWDTVLMSCEKKYEHFGGLTEESKKITSEFHKLNECKC